MDLSFAELEGGGILVSEKGILPYLNEDTIIFCSSANEYRTIKSFETKALVVLAPGRQFRRNLPVTDDSNDCTLTVYAIDAIKFISENITIKVIGQNTLEKAQKLYPNRNILLGVI